MGKRNSKDKAIYVNPLPITLSSAKYGELPQVFPHNPISWVYFVVKYLYIQLQPIPEYQIEVEYVDGLFKVTNNEDMKRLWTHGFFGKGSLSRSEPTWGERVKSKYGIGLDSNKLNRFSMEEITAKRREERKKFKALRDEFEQLELKLKKQQLTTEEESFLNSLKEKLSEMRKDIAFQSNDKSNDDDDNLLAFDDDDYERLLNLEYLELQAVEVFFLKYSLQTVVVKDQNTILLVKELLTICYNQNPNFLLEIVVYHHFRSLGWCVRSGIKFGCNMLLYNKGPPFSHAEFAVIIVKEGDTIDWTNLFSVSRVVGGVKKNLVICYVKVPEEDPSKLSDFTEFLEQCKVTEVLYRRWIPNRTRD